MEITFLRAITSCLVSANSISKVWLLVMVCRSPRHVVLLFTTFLSPKQRARLHAQQGVGRVGMLFVSSAALIIITALRGVKISAGNARVCVRCSFLPHS